MFKLFLCSNLFVSLALVSRALLKLAGIDFPYRREVVCSEVGVWVRLHAEFLARYLAFACSGSAQLDL